MFLLIHYRLIFKSRNYIALYSKMFLLLQEWLHIRPSSFFCLHPNLFLLIKYMEIFVSDVFVVVYIPCCFYYYKRFLIALSSPFSTHTPTRGATMGFGFHYLSKGCEPLSISLHVFQVSRNMEGSQLATLFYLYSGFMFFIPTGLCFTVTTPSLTTPFLVLSRPSLSYTPFS